jgi:non-specific serine/threonine protein kinase/serine/threonine-protein kinase
VSDTRNDPDGPPVPGAPPHPARVGPYRVLRLLGEGGMGCVYLAEQTAPVVREVALKLMHHSLHLPEDVARFSAERQILASLTHPHVARLFDAGTDERGSLYFVMEYVPGKPVTEYCDEIALGVAERLSLFCAVCRGVQHAHERGVLHRDLKPGNVIVQDVDGRPFPKVIDFGIAKAVNPPLTPAGVQTGFRAIGTPEYMSPEAHLVARDAPPLDARTDVYSLGVVLYQLLVGATPFDTRGMNALQIANTVTREEPPSPSERFRALDPATRALIASERGASEDALLQALGSGLDRVALTAVARERESRYASPKQLAEDLLRRDTGEPLLAKTVRRRRKILVIDDDPEVLLVWRKRLEDRGYDVVATEHPRSALRVATEHSPDLVVCDIDMEECSGGDVAAQFAREPATKALPFVFLSSLVDEASSGTAIGGWPMIAKSSPAQELLRWIEETLAGKDPRSR